ncbi:hypothetical protein GCM10010467_16860 [Actinocorallia glomerata]|uniref:Uncharacterized protein n=1 Tax=Actinocorallia glomerata TaxID=46203 RepID=A0ABP6PKY1_9ACTN
MGFLLRGLRWPSLRLLLGQVLDLTRNGAMQTLHRTTTRPGPVLFPTLAGIAESGRLGEQKLLHQFQRPLDARIPDGRPVAVEI